MVVVKLSNHFVVIHIVQKIEFVNPSLKLLIIFKINTNNSANKKQLTLSEGSSNSFIGDAMGAVSRGSISDGCGGGKVYTSFNKMSSNLNFLLLSLLSSFLSFFGGSLFTLKD